ncbi:MAG: Rrf2 family transcriptional regulator [PVC group bacterium]|nr:Rrf2 family transcriptional regulator [PVC group bacterium]
MKLITRDADYAIRAVCFIAKQGTNKVSVEELVREMKMPRPFLRKVLQILNKSKILKSYKGQGGGFTLALSPDKISLLGLIEVFQGKLKLNECTFKKQVCPNMRLCRVKKKVDSIQKFVVSELQGITVASLLKEGM